MEIVYFMVSTYTQDATLIRCLSSVYVYRSMFNRNQRKYFNVSYSFICIHVKSIHKYLCQYKYLSPFCSPCLYVLQRSMFPQLLGKSWNFSSQILAFFSPRSRPSAVLRVQAAARLSSSSSLALFCSSSSMISSSWWKGKAGVRFSSMSV